MRVSAGTVGPADFGWQGRLLDARSGLVAAGSPSKEFLLIEDEPELRRSLQLLFHGRGFAVRAFASPQALLADPALLEADCLIADYKMPELDGLQLMGELKQRGWSAPAVLITAYPSAKLTAQALELGYSEVAAKPFLDRSIVGTVTRLLAS